MLRHLLPPTLAAHATAAVDILGAIVGFFLLGVTFLVVLQFFLHFIDAVSRRGYAIPSPYHYLRAFVREWCCFLTTVLVFPTGSFPRPQLHYQPDGGPPILLVHGFFMNRSCLFAMARRLQRLGYCNVDAVNMTPAGGPMEVMGTRLLEVIRQLSQRCGGRDVVCVCHSMGGLVLRWCLQQDANLPVAKLVTLGTPHHGTRIAAVGFRPALQQMQPGSAFLNALVPTPRVPLTSIYSTTDPLMLPAETGALGERPIRFDALGHMSLLFDGRVFQAVADAIAASTEA